MIDPIVGSIIGAGTSILGGIMGGDDAKKRAQLEYQRQKEFAKKAIQWKAKDAEAAGISKLYALGANTTSYAPITTGGAGLGSGIAEAGQYLGRAIDAGNSQAGRQSSLSTAAAQVQLEGLKLDNSIKRQELLSKMALNTQPGTAPGVNSETTTPILPGQGNARPEITLERKLVPSGNDPQSAYGVNPDVDWYKTKSGWAPHVPAALGEALENEPFGGIQWAMRNKILPYLWPDHYATHPPAYKPPGDYWFVDPRTNEHIRKPAWRDEWIYR